MYPSTIPERRKMCAALRHCTKRSVRQTTWMERIGRLLPSTKRSHFPTARGLRTRMPSNLLGHLLAKHMKPVLDIHLSWRQYPHTARPRPPPMLFSSHQREYSAYVLRLSATALLSHPLIPAPENHLCSRPFPLRPLRRNCRTFSAHCSNLRLKTFITSRAWSCADCTLTCYGWGGTSSARSEKSSGRHLRVKWRY